MALTASSLTSGAAKTAQAKQNSANAAKSYNLGAHIGSVLHFDPTPGFNLTKTVGKGIPFISRTGQITSGTGSSPTPKAQALTNTPVAQDTTANTDPYAGTVFGSQAGYDKAVADYNSLKSNTLGSVNDAVGSTASDYNSSLLDYIDKLHSQQRIINGQATQNELAKMQGTRDVLDMVGHGIQSGGVMLANDNAGSSSAGDALARAYGLLGREQQSRVGSQYAQGQTSIDAAEQNLQDANDTEVRHSKEDKVKAVNSIVGSARTALAQLNQAAATASLPDRIDIEAKIADIKQQTMDALSKYDSVLSSGIADNAPASADTNRASAAKLLAAGTAPEHAFDYTTNIPAQFQDTGQFASSLPIFIAPKNKTLATA